MYDFTIIDGGVVGLSAGITIGQLYPNAQLLILEKENSWAIYVGDHKRVSMMPVARDPCLQCTFTGSNVFVCNWESNRHANP